MGIENFARLVTGLWEGSCNGQLVIRYEREERRYIANLGGIRIIGNPGTKMLSVSWGDGHVSMIDIAQVLNNMGGI